MLEVKMHSTFVVDVDGTLCNAPLIENGSFDYKNAEPVPDVVQKVRDLYAQGHQIIIFTARGMRTYQGDVEQNKLHVLPILQSWLERNQVPYHQIQVGKPWGPNVYYVDDRCIQPQDFVNLRI